jgi:hypothetical protein
MKNGSKRPPQQLTPKDLEQVTGGGNPEPSPWIVAPDPEPHPARPPRI